jgi:hypothetical protein
MFARPAIAARLTRYLSGVLKLDEVALDTPPDFTHAAIALAALVFVYGHPVLKGSELSVSGGAETPGILRVVWWD